MQTVGTVDAVRGRVTAVDDSGLARQLVRDAPVYADDTLVLGSTACHVEELAVAISQAGSNYGLTLHWRKIQALFICVNI